MKAKIDNGGAAFPFPAAFNTELGIQIPEKGMSLRDYFAAAALQGMIGSQRFDAWGNLAMASRAYEMADMMIQVGKSNENRV